MSKTFRANCDLPECSNWVSLKTNDMSIPEDRGWREVKLNLDKGIHIDGELCCYKHAVLFAIDALEEFVRSGITGKVISEYKEEILSSSPFETLKEIVGRYYE